MGHGRDFIERLQTMHLVGDGANGGRLVELGADIARGVEALNLSNPDLVRRVHEEYVDAGAQLIETNTFAANAIKLNHYNLADKSREINLAGAKLAREAAGKDVCVSGSIGPLGLPLEDEWDPDTVREAFRTHIGALAEGEVDLFHFETFTSLGELLFAVRAARDMCPDIPVIAQMLFGDGASVHSGESATEVARALAEAGADVIGVNCGRGVLVTAHAAKELVPAAGNLPVSAYPNAGYPESVDGRLLYMASSAYLADHAARMAKLGVRLLGGCCGTTPDTIRAIAQALSTIRRRAAAAAEPAAEADIKTSGPKTWKHGAFLESLKPARRPIIAEIDPPGTLRLDRVLERACSLVDAGADAISMAENPLTSLKVSNIAMATLLQQRRDTQTICHITCRDRNTLGLQSALMGAHALGIGGVLAISGDPVPPHADPGLGRSVFDLNSVTLVRLLARLNAGRSSTGRDLKGETNFSIGVAFNSAARNMDAEKARLGKKLAEGARFIMTQPVFDTDHARKVLHLTRSGQARCFLGFFPLTSSRAALYLHNEVPGITIPADVLERLTSFENEVDQMKAGIEMAIVLIDDLLSELDGVYLISPHTQPQALIPIIETLRSQDANCRL